MRSHTKNGVFGAIVGLVGGFMLVPLMVSLLGVNLPFIAIWPVTFGTMALVVYACVENGVPFSDQTAVAGTTTPRTKPAADGGTATNSEREHARERVEREAHPDEKRSIWGNATIGAAVTSVAYLIPGINLIAPSFGGFVAGYLQKDGASGGMKAGALKGLIMFIPAIIIALVASSLLAGMPIIGELLAGSIIIVVLALVLHSMAIGWFGGLIGGIVAGNS